MVNRFTVPRVNAIVTIEMKYDAFREDLRRAGISGRAFARLLKLNPNSITNYKAAGEVPSHLAVIASLIRAMHDASIDYEAAIARVPIAKKAARGVDIRKRPKS